MSYSFHVHTHTFSDGTQLFEWVALGPVGTLGYVRFIGSGTAASREEAEVAGAAYINRHKETHQS